MSFYSVNNSSQTIDIINGGIFKPYTTGSKANPTYFYYNGQDLNNKFEKLAIYSNLKYWDTSITNYFSNNVDLRNIFTYNLINDTNSNYIQYATNNGTLIIITNGTYMTFNNVNNFDYTIYMVAGGGGGGSNINKGNAGGGGGGGGVVKFNMSTTTLNFSKFGYNIGSSGSYAVNSDGTGGTGGNTNISLYDNSSNFKGSVTVYGGGGGGSGKNTGGNGGTGGGGGAGANSGPPGGGGQSPYIDLNSVGGGSFSFTGAPYSGGNGQKQSNDNGAGGGGGGVTGAGAFGSNNGGAGGKGFYDTIDNTNIYLGYGGGGGGGYNSSGGLGSGGAGTGGNGISGQQKGNAASFSTQSNTINAGLGGGGVGNNGDDNNQFGNGNGSQGLILLYFTNK